LPMKKGKIQISKKNLLAVLGKEVEAPLPSNQRKKKITSSWVICPTKGKSFTDPTGRERGKKPGP